MPPEFSRNPKRHKAYTSANAAIVTLESLLPGGAFVAGCNRVVIKNLGPGDPIYYLWSADSSAPATIANMDEIAQGTQAELPFRPQDLKGKVYVQVDVGTKFSVWEYQ